MKFKDISPKRHTSSSLPIHPYFGKVDPALASSLILHLSKEKDIVLDPFSGSGTVLHEAIINNRSAIGWDSSQLACLISTCKLMGILDEEIEKLNDFKLKIENHFKQVSDFDAYLNIIPSMPRVRGVSKWFTDNSLKELSFIKFHIKEIEDDIKPSPLLNFIWISFSAIITRSSNQKGESNYVAIEKDDYKGKTVSLFSKSIENTIKCAASFNFELDGIKRESFKSNDNKNSILFNNGLSLKTINVDSRNTFEGHSTKSDLVVSSPPYLMSWDYALYHKFRFYWMDFQLDDYEETEIGRHLRRKKDDVERYTADMTSIFNNLTGALNNDAKIALINAPSVVYGKLVDTNQILSECADEAGWKTIECIESIDIPGPHHGMYGSLKSRKANAPGEAGKKEHVLIFSRK